MRLIFSLLCTAVVAAPACASTPNSGIRGLVLRGPTQPVCTVGVPCEEPAPRATLAITKAGRIVARVRTNDKGRFSVTLPAGRYTVITTGTRLGQMAPSVTVTVRRAAYTHVTLRIDTGIR